jgi:hypothetical protein
MFGKNVDKAKVEVRPRVEEFLVRHLKSFMLVLYETWGYAGGSSNAHAWKFYGLVHFHLGTRIMLQEGWSNFSQVPLLFIGFGNAFIMVVMNCLMGRRIKDYSLTMNLTRQSIIPNGVVFFLNHLGHKCYKKKGVMVGPWISFVATFSWIAIGQNNSSSLWFYGQVFEASIKFIFEKLLLVPLVYG